jgi:hypothetical protein
MCTPTPRGRDGRGDRGTESKMDEGHATINWGDKGGDRVLLRVTARTEVETEVSTLRRYTQQPTGRQGKLLHFLEHYYQ